MTQTGFFDIDFAIVTEFLARRLDYIIIGTRMCITANLLTVTTIFGFIFICINRPHIYNWN